MHDYNVVWSRESIYDAADIADYIELRFGRERADRFSDDIDRECSTLGRDYGLYTGTGIYYRNRLILKKVFAPSIIVLMVLIKQYISFAYSGMKETGRGFYGRASATHLIEVTFGAHLVHKPVKSGAMIK